MKRNQAQPFGKPRMIPSPLEELRIGRDKPSAEEKTNGNKRKAANLNKTKRKTNLTK
jgi:hypothetical protein